MYEPETSRAVSWKELSVLAALLALVYLAANPWITLHQLRAAAASRDADALSQYIDFPAVRDSVKSQMGVVMTKEMAEQKSGFAVLGAAFSSMIIDRFIDTMMTPAGLRAVMSGKDPVGAGRDQSPTKPEEVFRYDRAYYTGVNRFVVETPNQKREIIRWVMKRDAFSWRIVDIQLPLDEFDTE